MFVELHKLSSLYFDEKYADYQSEYKECVDNIGCKLENMWKKTYEKRCEGWKSRQMAGQQKSVELISDRNRLESNEHVIVATLDMYQKAKTITDKLLSNMDHPHIGLLGPMDKENLTDIIRLFMLNPEQLYAFITVAIHSCMKKPPEPLKMYLGGASGTGKSMVIRALYKWFAV